MGNESGEQSIACERDLVLTDFHPLRIASRSQETDSKACTHTENACKLCAEEFALTLLTPLLASILVTIVTTVLLGLLLTPALATYFQNTDTNRQITVAGGYQILTINRELDVAIIEEKGESWTTIWNYNSGFIGTKVVREHVCYISRMNRNELPSFNALPRLAEENTSLKGQGQPTKEITFVIKRPIRDLKSYGPDIYAMCKGLRTYVAYEVDRSEYVYVQEPCFKFDVLDILGFKYCRSNTKA
ncbi:PREDICTED: gastrokine-1 [Nipponia nippon]|uniref:gastrokine-1 n=1 Tax=Nipponia nippon TaxID=128390 RepID=UPI0005109C47|nr:PREDICTED: gastrokine-1 [Nipponia nippon]